ncbi:MAG TPA: hypothetical protein PKV72_04930 [Candidatus Peribacteria bacterium]|nr:hypothetical protein [Candidatus Peribacteria bacterium]
MKAAEYIATYAERIVAQHADGLSRAGIATDEVIAAGEEALVSGRDSGLHGKELAAHIRTEMLAGLRVLMAHEI